MSDQIPLVTIDGPSGTGKGTISQMLAESLSWNYLDSGAIYRVLGLAVERAGLAFEDESAVTELATALDVSFLPQKGGAPLVMLSGTEVSADIRTEEGGARASKVASLPAVRDALLQRQRDFLAEPGLVADGRDMGTTVFPDAPVKIFLTASAEERARRRHKQLKDKGLESNIARLAEEIAQRDFRDENRSASPLRPAEDALILDTSDLDIESVFKIVKQRAEEQLG